MPEPQVQIVEESIASDDGSLITGIVFFDFGSFQFPEPDWNWNDFIVVIMGWWLSDLMHLLKGESAEIKLLFMDGPLWVSMQRKAGDLCVMQCIEGLDELIGPECEGSALGLLKSTLSAALRVQKICEQRGWRSADIETLESKVNEAQTLIRHH